MPFMKRLASLKLSEWLRAIDRQPLVLRGARQVGKTWLVRDLAQQHDLDLIEINFERANSEVTGIFRSKDPIHVLRALEILLGHAIDAPKSLLFLDEVQAMPEVFANLRWFSEELPELPVIAAGSLLDFVMANHSFSMPVGRIGYLHLEPMTFEEFAQAAGEDKLVSVVQQWNFGDEMLPVAHERLTALWRDFMIVGGMPAVVHRWFERGSFMACAELHQWLLGTYRDDFSKYSGRMPVERIGRVMESVPRMLGQTFKYTRVANGEHSGAVRTALDLLCRARLTTRVQASTGMGIPLGGDIRERIFKIIFLDSGLVCATLGLSFQHVSRLTNLALINEGGLAEQSVGQALRAGLPHFVERSLFFWTSEKKGAAAEVDYLMQHGANIVPVEVKVGTTGTLKSLHHFMAIRRSKLAARVNADMPSLTDINIKTTQGTPVRYRLMSIPFYLVGQLGRLLDAVQ